MMQLLMLERLPMKVKCGRRTGTGEGRERGCLEEEVVEDEYEDKDKEEEDVDIGYQIWGMVERGPYVVIFDLFLDCYDQNFFFKCGVHI